MDRNRHDRGIIRHRCRQCDRLLNGMCRICGCFVEMRAAIKVKSCPDVVPKW
ncbi:MAG: DUF6171 family protein [Lachnospiraceae bacterium]|nr:DUF6171 family protein [Lachnospiraceae bacterium]